MTRLRQDEFVLHGIVSPVNTAYPPAICKSLIMTAGANFLWRPYVRSLAGSAGIGTTQ